MSSIIDELKKSRVKDDRALDSLVNNLYENCLKMIKFRNDGCVTNMLFEVPVINIGFPLFDQEEVSLKFNKFLKKKGFKTIYNHPNKIYISW